MPVQDYLANPATFALHLIVEPACCNGPASSWVVAYCNDQWVDLLVLMCSPTCHVQERNRILEEQVTTLQHQVTALQKSRDAQVREAGN